MLVALSSHPPVETERLGCLHPPEWPGMPQHLRRHPKRRSGSRTWRCWFGRCRLLWLELRIGIKGIRSIKEKCMDNITGKAYHTGIICKTNFNCGYAFKLRHWFRVLMFKCNRNRIYHISLWLRISCTSFPSNKKQSAWTWDDTSCPPANREQFNHDQLQLSEINQGYDSRKGFS